MPARTVIPEYDTERPWGACAPTAWQAMLLAACHAMPRPLRSLITVLRKPIKYGVHHALDVTIWGLKLRLLPRGNMSERSLLFSPQLLDRPEFELLDAHLKPGDTFVDVGANVGVYTYRALRSLRGRGRVIAVEPDPEMRRRLQFNLASNAATLVEVVPAAMGDRQGHVDLLINLDQRGQNTVVGAQAAAVGGRRVTQPVELDTLVHVLTTRGVDRVDALKIDIETHEAPVLRHFFAHAPASLWPRLVITEFTAATATEIRALFAERGYRLERTTRLNLVFRR